MADALRVADAAEGLQREEEQRRRHTEKLYEVEQEKASVLRKLLSAREREIDVSPLFAWVLLMPHGRYIRNADTEHEDWQLAGIN